MENRECDICHSFYCGGYKIRTDWAYWDRSGGALICPECRGIDVEAEINATIEKFTLGQYVEEKK